MGLRIQRSEVRILSGTPFPLFVKPLVVKGEEDVVGHEIEFPVQDGSLLEKDFHHL